MFFKKKRKVLSDKNDAVSNICATCKFAIKLHSSEDFICIKKGMVSPDFTCKRYAFNHLLNRPQKKHNLSTGKLSAKDFEI